MGRWKIPAIGICVCFLVVVTLLTILFVVMNKHPETKIDLSSTDMRLLDRVSSVWCGSHEVSSSHPFIAYRITGEPIKERIATSNYHLNYSIKLRWGRERALKYYLLPGSSMEVQACSDRTGVLFRIFETIHKWKECKRLRNNPSFHRDSDSSSSEESDEAERGRDRVKGFLQKKSRHPRYPPDCEEAMQSHEIPDRKNKCNRWSLSLTVTSESTYVFSFEDYHNAADESNTEVQIFLNRTQYFTRNAMIVCHDVTFCEVPLSFSSHERTIVAIREEWNAGATGYKIVAKCKPRVLFFILLFAFIPLLLLLCIGCVFFCFNTRGKKKTTVKYIQVANNGRPEAPTSPLLSGPEVTIYSRTESYNRPPSYPESTAPPPYMPFQPPPTENKQK